MKRSFSAAIVVLLLPFVVLAQPVMPAMPEGSEPLFSKIMEGINRRHISWVKSSAEQVNDKNMTEDQVRTLATQYAVLGSISNADIEALCFLVLMQAAKSAQEDLKDIMAKVKSINKNKAAMREILAKTQRSQTISAILLDSFRLVTNQTKALQQGQNPDTVRFVRTAPSRKTVSKAELDTMLDQMKQDLDSMSEMSEMESLKLQMAMDRMSKMMSTLANLLKKISRTSDAIIQNLK